MDPCPCSESKREWDPPLIGQYVGESKKDKKNPEDSLVNFIRVPQMLLSIEKKERKKKHTVEEAVSVGLHQINPHIFVLVRQALGKKQEICSKK